MDYIISFFRDTLDGPIYIVVLIVAIILFFACIGYLAEKGIQKKKEKEKYQEVTPTASSPSSPNPVPLKNEATAPVTTPLTTPQVLTGVNEVNQVSQVSNVSEVATPPVKEVAPSSPVMGTPQVNINGVNQASSVQTVASPIHEVSTNNVETPPSVPEVNQPSLATAQVIPEIVPPTTSDSTQNVTVAK